MWRNRFLISISVLFLAASTAWADDVGYVDCSSHSEGAQVFGKPRKTPDTVANLACGERFTILVYGFYFSRVQTKDGQVGYIYSNLITQDRGATAVQQSAPPARQQPAQSAQQQPALQMATEKTKIPRTPPIDAEPAPVSNAQPQEAAAQVQPAQAQPASTRPTAQPAAPSAVAPAVAEASPAPSSPTPATTASEATATAPANPTVAAQPEAGPASSSVPSQPPATSDQIATTQPVAPISSAPEAKASVAEPTGSVTPPPAPADAQPIPAPIKPADRTETWERPRPGARTAPLMELYGGYAFARVGGASNGSNLNGAMGSFAWNPKSWLQIVGDTSYSFQTIGNTKNVLYGNHFGPRFFYRVPNRWGLTPFVEGLVGGSSLRTTVSGTGGFTASTGSALSYKVGGGIDIHPSRRWDIRLFDFDYYRTTFGSGTQQNNYWISTGVVLRILGGAE